jgi:hypothetical protein
MRTLTHILTSPKVTMGSPLSRNSRYRGGRDSCVKSFCPEHLLHSANAHASYAEFSPDGRSVVACFHSDHTYVFDVDEGSRRFLDDLDSENDTSNRSKGALMSMNEASRSLKVETRKIQEEEKYNMPETQWRSK